MHGGRGGGGTGGWRMDAAELAEAHRFRAATIAELEPPQLSASERKAVQDFVGPRGININRKLRRGQPLDKTEAFDTSRLDALIARNELTDDVVLHRVVAQSAASQIAEMNPGDVASSQGFVSTTLRRPAEGQGQLVVKILAPAGTPALVVPSAEGWHEEIVLARGARLEYVGEDPTDGLRTMRVLPASEGQRGIQARPEKPKAKPGATFDAERWRAMGMQEARQEWRTLPRTERDALANPRVTVPARIRELSGDRIAPDTGDPRSDIQDRALQHAAIVPAAVTAELETFGLRSYDVIRKATGDDKASRDLVIDMMDHVAAQEFEAMGRSLGDHGVRHIVQDLAVADRVLSQMPKHVNTPENRAMLAIAAAYHDSGYLTPPARVFLDNDHPRWSRQYYDEHVSPKIEKMFGKDFAGMTGRLIETHAGTTLDWENEPEVSAFSLADNLALFQRDKMPPVFCDVRGTLQDLVALGREEITVDEAKKRMRGKIDASDLSDRMKAQARLAVDEVSPRLPGYTLGMIGTSMEPRDVTWKTDHPAITLHRHRANEELARVLDVGQRQFTKLAETYGTDPQAFIDTGHAELKSKAGATVLELTVVQQAKQEEIAFEYRAPNGRKKPVRVEIKGKPQGGTIQEYDYTGKWTEHPLTTKADANKLAGIAKKMLALAETKRQVDGIEFNFDVDLSDSGQRVGRGAAWTIGLRHSYFDTALATMVHEIGHLTQPGQEGGMAREDYPQRRAVHEKQAWRRGLALLKKTGFTPSKSFLGTFRKLMQLRVSQYEQYFREREFGEL